VERILAAETSPDLARQNRTSGNYLGKWYVCGCLAQASSNLAELWFLVPLSDISHVHDVGFSFFGFSHFSREEKLAFNERF
jgi:hypothetical protein